MEDQASKTLDDALQKLADETGTKLGDLSDWLTGPGLQQYVALQRVEAITAVVIGFALLAAAAAVTVHAIRKAKAEPMYDAELRLFIAALLALLGIVPVFVGLYNAVAWTVAPDGMLLSSLTAH